MDSVHMVFGKLGNHTPVKAVADKASSCGYKQGSYRQGSEGGYRHARQLQTSLKPLIDRKVIKSPSYSVQRRFEFFRRVGLSTSKHGLFSMDRFHIVSEMLRPI